jgi:hypothetical protein
VINDRDTKLLFGPEERIRVTPFTGKEKGAKAAQIVLAHVIAVRVFPFDGPESRRCCKQDSHIMLGDQPPESAWVGSADRFALVKNRRVPIEKRSIDNVGVAHYPTDVRGGPEDFTRFDTVDIFHTPLERNQMAAIIADDSFGKTRGA